MFGLTGFAWKLIAIGIAIAAVLTYLGILHAKINYYKAEAQKYEQQYTTLVTTQEANRIAAVEAAAKQDKTRQESSAASYAEIVRLQNQHVKDIHELATLKTIVIPDLARRVFNATPTTGSEQADSAGKTDTVNATGSATLEDLLVANEENKANYLTCKEDKHQWIQLWKETERNLNGSTQ